MYLSTHTRIFIIFFLLSFLVPVKADAQFLTPNFGNDPTLIANTALVLGRNSNGNTIEQNGIYIAPNKLITPCRTLLGDSLVDIINSAQQTNSFGSPAHLDLETGLCTFNTPSVQSYFPALWNREKLETGDPLWLVCPAWPILPSSSEQPPSYLHAAHVAKIETQPEGESLIVLEESLPLQANGCAAYTGHQRLIGITTVTPSSNRLVTVVLTQEIIFPGIDEIAHQASHVSGFTLPPDEEIYLQAFPWFWLGDKNAALHALSQALTANPKFMLALYYSGSALSDLNRKNEALSTYQKALALEPSVSDIMINLGNNYYLAGQNQNAISWLKKAIEANPNKAAAYQSLGVIYYGSNQFQNQIDILEKGINLRPDYSDFYTLYGMGLDRLKRFQQALTVLLKANEILPNNNKVMNALGVTYGNLKQYDNEMECFNRAIAINPNDDAAYYNKGFALQRKGDFTNAVWNYKQALHFKPDDNWSLYQLGQTYTQIKNKAAASEIYKKLKPIDPDLANELWMQIRKM